MKSRIRSKAETLAEAIEKQRIKTIRVRRGGANAGLAPRPDRRGRLEQMSQNMRAAPAAGSADK